MTKEYVCMDCFGLFEAESHLLSCEECNVKVSGCKPFADVFINPIEPTGKVLTVKILKDRMKSSGKLTLVYDVTSGTLHLKDEDSTGIEESTAFPRN